ncbi:MAG: cobalt-precorrin 5A hydrolase [Chloroflexi bacterium]|nr:cobalt-precorrin 5A hydrolase [Chloroflexota bacterium]
MSIDSFSDNETAIVALTRKGVELGRRLRPLLPGSRLYLPEKFAVEGNPDEHSFLPPAEEVVREVFHQYRYLVLIMAVGIAVRLIASQLRDKYQDPGVVAVDDAGTFSISLLSGHIGGANELSKKIASFLGAHPVVTTASEVGETIAVDLLGKEFGWELEDNSNVTKVSAALVNGESVGIYQDAGERNWWPETRPLPDNVRIFASIEALIKADCAAALIITDTTGALDTLLADKITVVYRPRSLVVGMGCRRGVPVEELESLLAETFQENGLSLECLAGIATAEIKRGEPGLEQLAERHGVPLSFFQAEELNEVFETSPGAVTSKSERAHGLVGVWGVAEPAALLTAGAGELLVTRKKTARATIAIARRNFDAAGSAS